MRTVLALLSALALPATAAAAPLPPSGTLDLAGDADATLAGEAPGDQAGWAVAPAGDVNGDGKADYLVGAPNADPGGRKDAGRVYVVFGPPASGKLGDHGFRIDGAAAGDRLGTAVAGVGDVDGDGFADVLVGAPKWTDSGGADGTGAAYLIRGSAAGGRIDLAAAPPTVTTFATGVVGDQVGVALAAAPDMDGDGRSELVIGAARANQDAGSVFVVFSRAPGGLAGALRIDGPAGSRTGLAVAGVADMNGDGRGEIVVGAPRANNGAGAGFVVFGRADAATVDLNALGAQGFAITPAADDGSLGLGVAGLGDMNGDGKPDVAFGAPTASRNQRKLSGEVYVVAGKASADSVASDSGFRLDGAAEGDELGASVTAAGDVNADGLPDLAAAAPFADTLSRTDGGGVYVLLGSKTPAVADGASLGAAGYRLAGAEEHGLLRSVAGLGDVDGDGAGDLLAGAHGAGAGRAFVVLGPKPAPPAPVDPGVIEEQQAGCTAADNVEMLIDDSGSMEDSDPELLRRRAVELMIAKPRNQGEVLGAYEFGTDGDQLFAPQEILPRGDGSNQPALLDALEKGLRADNGSTNYNAAFTGVANDDPAADARIFITDGEHNEGEYLDGHRGGPPTYVIGLDIGTRGDAAKRLQRIADETKAKYYPNVTGQRMQAVIDRIDSHLNCDIGLDADTGELTGDDPVGEQEATLDSDAHAYDVDVMWGDPADRVVPDSLAFVAAGGHAVARLRRDTLERIVSRPGRTFRVGKLRVRGARRPTFFSLRVSGPKAAKLRVRYRMTKFKGRGARVTAQVTQSRRRR